MDSRGHSVDPGSPSPRHQLNGSTSGPLSDRENDVVPVGFDETVLRHLIELDCGLPLMLDRIKQDATACREVATFLRQRAKLEDEYGRNSIKLARSSQDAYRESDGKAGSFVSAYQTMLKSHESLGENRVRFAQQMNEMADQLGELQKEMERSRKLNRDQGTQLEKQLKDAESATDKARSRFESAQEELERLLVMKAGESAKDLSNTPYASSHSGTSSPPLSFSTSSGGIGSSSSSTKDKRTFGKAMSKIKAVSGSSSLRNPAQLARMEEELRTRCGSASDSYSREVRMTDSIRQNHFKREMPRVLRALKEAADEVDLGTQYHLARYAHLFEHVLVQDGLLVAPVGGVEESSGMKAVAESIDNREDFRVFMSNYVVAFAQSGVKPLRRDGGDELPGAIITDARRPSVGSVATSSNQGVDRRTFGVDLSYQMSRDVVDAPTVLTKCAAVIEEHGLDVTGIYRLSGTTSRVQRLKARLDKDIDAVDLFDDENLQDINDITGVLKLWFRELPEPLMTYDLYGGFVEAAKIENDRLRHIRLHERVNELPDANYATLKYLMGHLDKVSQNGEMNQMRASNLAIVFGPTLFRPPPDDPTTSALSDMSWQCKAIETILTHNHEIFVLADEEEQPQSTPSSPVRRRNASDD